MVEIFIWLVRAQSIVTNVCIVKYYEILVTTIIYSLLLQIRAIYNNLNMSK